MLHSSNTDTLVGSGKLLRADDTCDVVRIAMTTRSFHYLPGRIVMQSQRAVSFLLVVTAAGFPATTFAQDANKLAKATAELKQANAQEKLADDEYFSREMARSATREIARSERKRASAALTQVRAAQKALAAVSSGKSAAKADALRQAQQALEDRFDTMRAVGERLIADTNAADKASRELFISEFALRDGMAKTRTAEAAVLEAKAGAEDDAATRRAVFETKAVRIFELQQWAATRKTTARQMAEHSGGAASIAMRMAAAECDPTWKQRLTEFSKQESLVKAEATKVIAEQNKVIKAIGIQIYPLKAGALGGLKLLSPDQWSYEKARHLLVRAGFGGTPKEVEQLHAKGLYKAVEDLVHFQRKRSTSIAFDPVPPPQPDFIETKLRDKMRERATNARLSHNRQQINALRRSWVQRMVVSDRPLQEKLALFWHGHFATQNSVVQSGYDMYRQNTLFREYAAGNFGALLYSIVHDPAMIRFLDNNKNVKGAPNENLAREIMELFAMGVDQGYTEKDIIEGARALTGYTFSPLGGGFRVALNKHDDGNKTIFDQTGSWTGDQFVGLILEQPQTSRFIARKLFEYFVYRDPDPESVNRLASVLKSSNYELAPMLENLFMSEEFYSSRAIGNRIKSPVELVVGILREFGVKKVNNYNVINNAIQQMGQQLFEPPDVKGWRYGRSWISSARMFARYNSVARLVTTGKHLNIDVLALLEQGKCKSAEAAIDYLAKTCLVRALSGNKRNKLIRRLGKLPEKFPVQPKARAAMNRRLRAVLILMVSMPEYQMT